MTCVARPPCPPPVPRRPPSARRRHQRRARAGGSGRRVCYGRRHVHRARRVRHPAARQQLQVGAPPGGGGGAGGGGGGGGGEGPQVCGRSPAGGVSGILLDNKFRWRHRLGGGRVWWPQSGAGGREFAHAMCDVAPPQPLVPPPPPPACQVHRVCRQVGPQRVRVGHQVPAVPAHRCRHIGVGVGVQEGLEGVGVWRGAKAAGFDRADARSMQSPSAAART